MLAAYLPREKRAQDTIYLVGVAERLMIAFRLFKVGELTQEAPLLEAEFIAMGTWFDILFSCCALL